MTTTDTAADTPTVLIVDDDRELADMYAYQLDEAYTVRTAYSGQHAIDALDESVDVMLLDRRMPRSSGRRVLDRVRDSEHDCRVIMVTAVDPGFDIIDLPCDDYLCKPVNKATLEATIDQQLAARSYDRSVRELLRAVSKLAVLDAEKPDSELAASERYQALTRRVAAMRQEAESALTELTVVESAFTAIDRSTTWDGRHVGT